MSTEVHTTIESKTHLPQTQVQASHDLPAILSLLSAWVERHTTSENLAWLHTKLTSITAADQQTLYLSFGQTARKFPKTSLELSKIDIEQASHLRKNWHIQHWRLDQLVRSLLVLSFPAQSVAQYLKVIDKLFATGEVHELIALYQALPIFPFAELFIPRATEGIRTNMQVVFCAVAHHNPFPADFLDEMSFNQMVLKAIFVGVPLYKIVGLEDRANAVLSKMLCDYAKERWAAKRTITPELWRNVGRFADEAGLTCIHRLIEQGTPLEIEAGRLALKDANQTETTASNVEEWNDLGRRLEATQIT